MVQSIRVTCKSPLSLDASSESGTEFFYEIINAHTSNCAIIVNKAYLYDGLSLGSPLLYSI